jgi:hypothetical protein
MLVVEIHIFAKDGFSINALIEDRDLVLGGVIIEDHFL